MLDVGSGPTEEFAMADIVRDQRLADQDLRAHEETFHGFSKLVLFSILHITLVLGCLALAFLGNAPIVATLLGVGGTVALLAIFAIAR
jgi:hypothetical protein